MEWAVILLPDSFDIHASRLGRVARARQSHPEATSRETRMTVSGPIAQLSSGHMRVYVCRPSLRTFGNFPSRFHMRVAYLLPENVKQRRFNFRHSLHSTDHFRIALLVTL